MIPPYKAYLTCNWMSDGSRSLSVVVDDEMVGVTGIDATLTQNVGNNNVYDLSGRLVGDSKKPGCPLQPGLYINNGRKIVVSRKP